MGGRDLPRGMRPIETCMGVHSKANIIRYSTYDVEILVQ